MNTSLKTGVLLVNLGTPAAPTPAAVRAYLAEFLGDPHVVALPRSLWLPLLHGLVLPFRAAASAARYSKIWQPAGSPLQIHTARQRDLLKQRLASVPVEYAMRYGTPDIASRLDKLKAQDAGHIVVVPLYPQYAASTTASVVEAVESWQRRTYKAPTVKLVHSFAEHPDYIDALAANIRRHWQRHGRGQKLVMSFHGLPQRAVERGDPYQKECFATAHRLAAALGLGRGDYLIAFQSRFGLGRWLQPSTLDTLEQLARNGVGSVDIVCPGFVADCLETLEEIDIECRAAFLAQGGREFRYIPCLNDSEEWINALSRLCL